MSKQISKMSHQTLITDYFKTKPKIITGYNPETQDYHCLYCGDNMGPHNPRQLCGKSYCYNDSNNYFNEFYNNYNK